MTIESAEVSRDDLPLISYKSNKTYPDYTAASPKIYKDRQGYYYLVGEYIPEFKDPDKDAALGRFRKRAGERDTLILKQALADGSDCVQVFSQDAGQAGQSEFLNSSARLIEEGLIVKKDPIANNKTKLTKFQPFAAACENGLVFIVENTFRKETLEDFYKELELFDGERSTATRKDDYVDATATCFNYVAKEKVIPSFSLPSSGTSSRLTSLKEKIA